MRYSVPGNLFQDPNCSLEIAWPFSGARKRFRSPHPVDDTGRNGLFQQCYRLPSVSAGQGKLAPPLFTTAFRRKVFRPAFRTRALFSRWEIADSVGNRSPARVSMPYQRIALPAPSGRLHGNGHAQIRVGDNAVLREDQRDRIARRDTRGHHHVHLVEPHKAGR